MALHRLWESLGFGKLARIFLKARYTTAVEHAIRVMVFKVDGFFFFTRWIRFGVGRAMMDSAQEIRNHHIDKEEGISIMRRFEGEHPSRYEKEFLEYIGMSREEFLETRDRYRSPHLWKVEDGEWKLLYKPY